MSLYRLPVFLGPLETQPPPPQRAPSRWGHFFLGRMPAHLCYASMAPCPEGDQQAREKWPVAKGNHGSHGVEYADRTL